MKKSLLNTCSSNTKTRIVEKETLKITKSNNIESKLKSLSAMVKSKREFFYTSAKSSINPN